MQDLITNYGQNSSSSDDESSTHENTNTTKITRETEVGAKRKLTDNNERLSLEPPKKRLKLPSIFDEEKKLDTGISRPSL